MAATTQTEKQEKQVSLKLLVNEETNKVLFAEAKKDFVNILCSILTLHLGTIARLVRKESNIGPVIVGCLNNLYQSMENFDPESMSTETCKETLLKPRLSCYCSTLKLNIDDTEPEKYFITPDFGSCSCRFLSTSPGSKCSCGYQYLSRPVFLNDFRKGFVIGVPTYIITDDLIVIPNSSQTNLGFLQNFGVRSLSSANEMIVNVTTEKGLDLLKYSLLSKTTLTDLFLRKKPFLEMSNFSPCSAENNSTFQIKLTLAIRKSDNKILYAQGEEDFADILLCFLTFPLGGAVRVLGGNCSMGSIDGLYKSIADLAVKYFEWNGVKKKLIDPRLAQHLKLRKKILPIHAPDNLEYSCHKQYSSDEFVITDYRGALGGYFKEMDFSNPMGSSHEGFVKGPAMYMATDDLVLTPMSPISVFHLLSHLKTNFSDMKEKTVTIGIKECLSILKASLTSKSALTNGLSHLLTEVAYPKKRRKKTC